MKIALIYPKLYGYQERPFGIGGYARIMLGYPPLSLAYVAAIIKRAGHEAIIIDGNILNLGLKEVVKKIKDFSPDLLGFSVTTSTFHNVTSWIRAIKKIINAPVIAGGALLDLYPREIMQYKEIDYAVIGTGIDSIPELLKVLSDKGNLSSVPGLCFRRGDEVILNEREQSAENISELPFPARELLPNHKYYSPFSLKKNFTALITSRGCLFKCAYCCLPGELQLKKAEDVIEEMAECYYRFDIKDIDIYDTIFTADRERAVNICRGIRRRGLDFAWATRTHINYVDKELLEEMAASGCGMIMYGIESTDQAVLKNLKRPIVPVNKIKDMVRLTKKAGISAFGFFMLGTPGETYSTIDNTVRFSKKSGFDFVQFSRLIIIPGTRLYKEYLNGHKQDHWRGFVLDSKQGFPVIAETLLPQDVIMRYVKNGNMGFYLHPLRIIRIILNLKSLRQLINYIKAGMSMLFSYALKYHE